MQQYPSYLKQCATCEYWAGAREPADRWGNRISVESPMSRGRCMHRHSGWFNSPEGKQAIFKCPYWEKWSVLDKMK